MQIKLSLMDVHGAVPGATREYWPFITAELAALSVQGLLSLLQMDFLFYATTFLQ